MKRSHIAIALYMLAVFVSGSVVGAFAHRLYSERTMAAPPRSASEFRKRYVTEMQTRLKLDEAQTVELDRILEETRTKFKEFNERHKDELSGIHAEQVREIRTMLRPEQQGEYEKFLIEREKKREKEKVLKRK